jgi:hypothetical protein
MSAKILWGFIAALTACGAADAEDAPADKLPEPGSWVRYYVIATGPNITGESTSTLTLKFLDRVQEQGRDCRWIELDDEPTSTDEGRSRSVHKLLLPEEALLRETNPCRVGIRGWQQYGQAPPQPVETRFKGKAFDMQDIYTGPLLVFLPGSRAKLRRLDESATVEFQRGRLEQAVVFEGQHKAGYNSTISDYRFDYTVECRVELHDDLPCGIAAGKMKWIWSAVKPDGTVEQTQERGQSELVLQDFGVGAKSALPDSN